MTSRFLVIAPEANLAQRAVDELIEATSAARAHAFDGTSLAAAISDSDAALTAAVEHLRSLTDDVVIIEGVHDEAVALFDSVAWNLQLAASTKSRVILALDVEGRSVSLLQAEINALRSRAELACATVAGVIVPGVAASQLAEVGLPVLPLPLGSDTADTLLGLAEPTAVTPLAFQADLIDQARSQRKRIVLPEPEDDRVLKAAAEVLARGIADVIFVGDATQVSARATELGLDLSAATTISVDDPAYAERYAVEFARLREKKGVTVEQARETIKDVSYFGTMMVHMGDADGMVSGAAHTTAHTIVPSFQIIKTAPGVSIVSSIFLMLMKDRVWAFGDCAVNPNPTPEQLADIAISSATTARQFGIEPKVAMLSYSTGSSGSGVDVEAVIEATRIAREKAPELAIEGPIQFDASVDADVAAQKLPGSPVAGQANVFIFPTLNAGNIGYKAVQRSSGAVAVGPVLQGLNKPVNDLSRGALVEDIVNTVALTAVQAQG